MPGKCLTAPATPGRLQPAQEREPVPRDVLRPVAERADADGRVGRVRGEVERRRVDDVDAHRPGLEPDRPTDRLGQLEVVRRAEGHVPGERRRARRPGR